MLLPPTDDGTNKAVNQLIERGIAQGLITFDADQKNIVCRIQNKRFRFNVEINVIKFNHISICKTNTTRLPATLKQLFSGVH